MLVDGAGQVGSHVDQLMQHLEIEPRVLRLLAAGLVWVGRLVRKWHDLGMNAFLAECFKEYFPLPGGLAWGGGDWRCFGRLRKTMP